MDRSNGYEAVAVEFLARRGSGRSTGVGVHAVGEWREHCQGEPQSLIWAAGRVSPSPKFWSRKDLMSLPSMQRHPSSKHSDAIYQTDLSFAKLSKIQPFSIELSRAS